MWDYTDKVKDHFFNPRNVGKIENPDGIGEEGSLACGDSLTLTFKLDENKRIKDAKFQTFGCGSAIASASALTEIIIGKTLDEAEKITNNDIADYLGGLPDEKMHCSVMGREALEAAIANYRGEDVSILRERHKNVVCQCFGVTDTEIIRTIKENQLKTVQDVINYTKAGGGCKECHPKIEELLIGTMGVPEERAEPTPQKIRMTNIQKIKLIEEILEREIRPALKADGGDIDLIDLDGNKVIVALRGMCSSCPSSSYTLKEYVEAKLKEFVSDDIVVEENK